MSTYEPIASQTLASAGNDITFSSLPQNYTDLIIVGANLTRSSANSTFIRFNGDTSSNYSYTFMAGNGTSATSSRASSQTSALIANGTTGLSNTTPTMFVAQIMNYNNSATFKTYVSRDTDSNGATEAIVGLWRKTPEPITSLTIFSGGNYNSGATFTVYGVSAGNSSAKASGGNIVTTDGSYWYHTFTSSGTFIPSQALTADYLVIAGGGGGANGGSGATVGGGGGAGGLRCTVTATGGGGSLESALSLSANTVYQALIGAGGAVGQGTGTGNGASGTDSTFATITSIGGGGGGGSASLTAQNGLTGGSGGGGGAGESAGTGTGGTRTVNQGYAGGNGFRASTSSWGAGGGGGAGAVGSNGAASAGGAGGNGVATSITGSSITYAGGGGGAGGDTAPDTGGAGGTGGGGTGGELSGGVGRRGTNATVNTGSGGGGTRGLETTSLTGSGGSGIIVIRYAV
jgi:hypothetical protein